MEYKLTGKYFEDLTIGDSNIKNLSRLQVAKGGMLR